MASKCRHGERYGDVVLSIQASSWHYCTPKTDGLPLEQYEEVEVAVVGPEHEWTLRDGRTVRTTLYLPSQIGVEGFDHLFSDNEAPVAGWMSWEDVERLRAALRARQQAREAAEEAASGKEDA